MPEQYGLPMNKRKSCELSIKYLHDFVILYFKMGLFKAVYIWNYKAGVTYRFTNRVAINTSEYVGNSL